MQRLSSWFLILAASFGILFLHNSVEAQSNIQKDTILSLEAGTNECEVVQDYCYGINTQNVRMKGYIVSHGIVAVAAVIHEIALGLHAQNETVPFPDPDSVMLHLNKFAVALKTLLDAVSENQAVFVGGGLKQDFTDNLAFLVGKIDFFTDELGINVPKPSRNAVMDVKYRLDRDLEDCIGSFH